MIPQSAADGLNYAHIDPSTAAPAAAREHMGAFHHPSTMPEDNRIVAGVRAYFDNVAVHAAWAEGRSMTLEHRRTFGCGAVP